MFFFNALVIFLGFYLLYLTSKKAAVSRLLFRKWAKNNATMSKAIGVFLILTSLVIYIAEIGFGAGFFFTLITLMASASLIVILLPLQWRSHTANK